MNQLKLLKKPSESRSSPYLQYCHSSLLKQKSLMYNTVIQTFVKKSVNKHIVNKWNFCPKGMESSYCWVKN